MATGRLEGLVCLVTGASRGIGAAIARKAAEEGALVAVNYSGSTEQARALVRSLHEQGYRALSVQADVSRSDEVEKMFEVTEQELGPVDLLVNNAGVSLRALLTETSEEQWERIIGVNLKGAYLCCRRALPSMICQKYGRIVNIASVQGISGASCEAAYAASKGGLITLTKSLASEVGPSGILVNSIAPGPISTDMLRTGLSQEDLELLTAEIPAGRLGDPGEIAAACAYLLSPEAGYINGQILTIDGGWKL